MKRTFKMGLKALSNNKLSRSNASCTCANCTCVVCTCETTTTGYCACGSACNSNSHKG